MDVPLVKKKRSGGKKSVRTDVIYKTRIGKTIPSQKTIEKYKIPNDILHLCLQHVDKVSVSKNRVTRLLKLENYLGIEHVVTVCECCGQPVA